jgi:molybdopterin converting factor small subunit
MTRANRSQDEPRVKIFARVRPEVQEEKRRLAAQRGMSESQIVEEALTRFLNIGDNDETWLEAAINRLSRQRRELNQIRERMDVLYQAFDRFMLYWFSVGPGGRELTDEEEEQVRREGPARYRKFYKTLRESLEEGRIAIEKPYAALQSMDGEEDKEA